MFRNLMISLKNNLPIIFLCIALQILLGVILSHTYLLYHNTIYNNADWVSTKTNLEKGVLGAVNFTMSRQALAKGHLNLGVWHGFQEVFYKDQLRVKGVEFDFWLEPNSYVNIIFNKCDKGFSCVRFSVNKQFESKYLVASALGGFLEKMTIDTSTLHSRRWHNAKLHFDDGAFSLLLDDEEIVRVSEHMLHEQRIGFRGCGYLNTYIDNVVIHQYKSTSLHESFSNKKNVFRVTVFFLVLVGMFNCLIFLLLRFAFRNRGKNAGFYLVMLNMVLIVISFLCYGYIYQTWKYYPRTDESLRIQEEYWKDSGTADVVKEIRNTYGEILNKNTFRILFIGSSQTWGAGASKQSRTFVNNIENKLNKSGIQETQFECINAGIAAVDSSYLLDFYKRECLQLEPRMVVINLSHNDNDIDMFASNLQNMIEISVRAGIQPIFVLEANSVECIKNGLIEKHEAMRRVGATHDVPVIDMHAYLCKKYDEGFLWWDSVHLTDFGQELLSKKLYKELVQVMKNKL